ncbi:alpha/beta fold hydrolase [Sneathiella chinensis]|uniref:Alpha/beta hydrolase n=1 Tax=Sneathiella chinensis TaxID=349750 RepID=A0ABQ5U517_9PROT|nr:alpha/beta hydrolase [Sneathiella chinensis]GLQ07260.1 alpha/beta hydrolase [Sneathiella chinensis]
MLSGPTHKFFQSPDIRISYYEWGNPSDQTVLLVHATGMHARCWDKTIAALKGAYHIIAVDQRGHGLSDKPGPIYDWSLPAEDISALVLGLDLNHVIAVGHSMGGHCLTQVVHRNPDRFDRLILVDPVIFDPDFYRDAPALETLDATDHPIARRRNEWQDWQQMFDAFKNRHPYDKWRPEVLEDYCKYGLLPIAGSDRFELACPPFIEASVYTGHRTVNVNTLVRDISLPVLVLRAQSRKEEENGKMDFAVSPTCPALASRFPNATDIHLSEMTHFIPMEDPERMAAYIDGLEG